MTDSIGKFEKLNNKLTSLLEENKKLKQQHKETLRINSELDEKLKESNEKVVLQALNLEKQLEEIKSLNQQHKSLQEENQRINSELKEKLQEKDEQLKKLKQKLLILEKQKNEFEIMSQNLEKALEILELDEINENDDKTFKEKISPLISEQHKKETTTFPLNDNDGIELSQIPPNYLGALMQKAPPDGIIVQDTWHDYHGRFKTNTALKYDNEYKNVISWGAPALAKRQIRRKQTVKANKPKSESNVLLVLTVPAEFSSNKIAIMRDCAFNAGLLKERRSTNLQFTTEAEAAAISCMKQLREHGLKAGDNFMVVDCGGGTVDLTIRKLINDNQMSETTERTGDFCGSTNIDNEFIKHLSRILGHNAMEMFRENHYEQMQYLIKEFCKSCKLPFNGEEQDFSSYELDLDLSVPMLKKYITNDMIEKIEEDEGIIEIGFNDIKSMFDPVVEKILRLIRAQLDNCSETISAIFLVGVRNILIPGIPTTAIEKGAVLYGLSSMNSDLNVIASRVLKYTYGVKVRKFWTKNDPIDRKIYDERIDKFGCLAKRGTPMKINQKITCSFLPLYPTQTKVVFYLYYTKEYDAQYCDEPGMNLLGILTIDLSGSGLDNLSFGLAFGHMEVSATAINETKGKSYDINFEFNV
ncbi:171_t:CDS:2 [Funneliformis geosporum]|nr:171_t:CDS:2 [Funneliformis geosporum]